MTMVVKKTPVDRMYWKKVLAKYPRLIACMIDESLGYFTPHAAVNAIVSYKTDDCWSCEWYAHIDSCQSGGKLFTPGYEERVKAINHDVISEAFKKRKFYYSARARQVVQANLGENESIGAAWF